MNPKKKDKQMCNGRGIFSSLFHRKLYWITDYDKAFDYLDAPVLNCTGKDVPMPYAENLEKAALITPDEISFIC